MFIYVSESYDIWLDIKLVLLSRDMGQAESNESAAVKRQAEGGAVPMYQLLDLSGNIFFRYEI